MSIVRIYRRVRTRDRGHASAAPPLCVFVRSRTFTRRWWTTRLGRTPASASSLDTDTRKQLTKGGSNIAAAKVVGKVIAERAIAAGVSLVVFDRGGTNYHGPRQSSRSDAAREARLKF